MEFTRFNIIVFFLWLVSTTSVWGDTGEKIKNSSDISKSLPECAKIKSDKIRLNCFDDFTRSLENFRKSSAKTLDSLLKTLEQLSKTNKLSTTGPIDPENGYWQVSEDIDPIDDSKTTLLYVQAESVVSRFGQTPTLAIKCKGPELNLYINWSTYIGREKLVEIRFDKEKSEKRLWELSTDGQATFYPSNYLWNLLERLKNAKKLAAKITPSNSNSITEVFKIEGISNTIKIIHQACMFQEREKIHQINIEINKLEEKENELHDNYKELRATVETLVDNIIPLKIELEAMDHPLLSKGNEKDIATIKEEISNTSESIVTLESKMKSELNERELVIKEIKTKELIIENITRQIYLKEFN